MSNGLPAVSLDDKYTATSGRIYLNGTQALVRLILETAVGGFPGLGKPAKAR